MIKPSELKKDKITSVRFSSEVEAKIKEVGFKSVQSFFNYIIDTKFEIKITNSKKKLDKTNIFLGSHKRTIQEKV